MPSDQRPGRRAVWRDALGLAIVATVVDRVSNGADATTLEILGARRPLGGERLAGLIADPGVAFAQRGPRRALHIPLYPWLLDGGAAQTTLELRGFVPAYTCFTMRRPSDAVLLEVPPLETGFRSGDARRRANRGGASGHGGDVRWSTVGQPVAVGGLPASGHLGTRPMARVARRGTNRRDGAPPSCHRGGGRDRAARSGAGVSGPWHRTPAWWPKGCACLPSSASARSRWTWKAANDRALDLYRRFGFEVVVRTPVWEIALR